MKWLRFVFVGVAVFAFLSCEKENKKFDKSKHGLWECGVGMYNCTDDRFEDPYIQQENLEVFIFEPLVISDDCNCIVQGAVKYVENGKTVALVYYGDGECGSQAKKVLCVNGDCKSKFVSYCYFTPSNCDFTNQTDD